MKTILVIEDNIDALELLASWIRNIFKGVAYTACNVREALEVLGSHQFDIIICDYELPDGTGEDVLKHLRQQKIVTPTILFSAHSDLSMEITEPLSHVISDKDYARLFTILKEF
ncbi:MAG: response regulator [Bacteriovoracaceae bacterium]